MTPQTRERLARALDRFIDVPGAQPIHFNEAHRNAIADALAPIIDELVGAWQPIETAPRSANLNDRIFWLAWSPLYPDCPVVMNAGIYWGIIYLTPETG